MNFIDGIHKCFPLQFSNPKRGPSPFKKNLNLSCSIDASSNYSHRTYLFLSYAFYFLGTIFITRCSISFGHTVNKCRTFQEHPCNVAISMYSGRQILMLRPADMKDAFGSLERPAALLIKNSLPGSS